MNSKLRCIYSCYFFRSGDSCIQCKRTGMCKAVQYPRIFTKLLNRKTIIFLVKEKSCLLSVFDIDLISDTIFLNFDKCRKFFPDKSFVQFHTFLLTDFCIASLINTADRNTVFRENFLNKIQNQLFPAIDSKRQRLYDQNILKLVNHKSRKKIRLAKDHAAARSIRNLFAVFPCIPHALLKKIFINLLIFISCQKTNGNFGISVDKTSAKRISVKIMYKYNISIYKTSHD